MLDTLAKNENIIYLYAAQDKVSLFEKNPKFSNLSNRIQYLGFVDVFIYARVIDLMIDTFPFGSGQVGLHMIANGNAIVTLKTLESELSSWYTYVAAELSDAASVSKFAFPIPPSSEISSGF